jgi:hypothetical protein
MTFTSYHMDPNGYQNLYIEPPATKAVGFTLTSLPLPGMQTSGFAFDGQGVLTSMGRISLSRA